MIEKNASSPLSPQEILSRLGINALSPMQKETGSAIVNGSNVVLLSPTGSGKTLAYLLPIAGCIENWAETGKGTGPIAIVVVPTRELARQSWEVWQRMKTGISALCLHGGRPTMEEHRQIREQSPALIFATPGRLNDHLVKKNFARESIYTLVIDEFDKSLELGFKEEMLQIIHRLPNVRQTILLSATDSPEIPAFLPIESHQTKRIDYLKTKDEDFRVRLLNVQSAQKDKLETLKHLLLTIQFQFSEKEEKDSRIIIFVAHRESANRVGAYLKKIGFASVIYHGGMEQEQRERNLFRFRAGSASILVATDLAARGLDIPQVTDVIHYHLPMREEDYVHRAGRTARWDRSGNTYFIVGPTEHLPDFLPSDTVIDYLLPSLEQLNKLQPIPPHWTSVYIGRGKREKLSKGDIVGFFCKQCGLHADEIGSIEVGAHHAYVSILTSRAYRALSCAAGEKIKGMKTIVEQMRH